MLLLIALTLKGSIAISPTPPPPNTGGNGGGGGIAYSNTYHDKDKERREQILIEDSEIISIVELTLKNFII